VLCTAEECNDGQKVVNISSMQEQDHTELNQRDLLKNQPLPTITWSMERDNLIKLKKLQNDRTINFFMYIFIEGVPQPIGYYQVNKVSSVNSQLSNPQQIITGHDNNHMRAGSSAVIDSPSEDGSYGTNGDAVFGFTPEGICIQTNMHYITSTVPLNFQTKVICLAIINTIEAKHLLDASIKAMK
jgi:hypothetical protein